MENQPTSQKSAKPSGKSLKRPAKRRGGALGRIVMLIALIAVIGLFAWAEMQRREAVNRLQNTEQELEEIRTSTQRSGQEVANQVLTNVRSHIDIPQEPAPTVATIVNVEQLRESSEFYQKADNGDHLIITENRAILFDPDRNIILDVVPVRINREDQNQQPGDAETSPDPEGPNASPDPNSSPTPEPEENGENSSPSPEATFTPAP